MKVHFFKNLLPVAIMLNVQVLNISQCYHAHFTNFYNCLIVKITKSANPVYTSKKKMYLKKKVFCSLLRACIFMVKF